MEALKIFVKNIYKTSVFYILMKVLVSGGTGLVGSAIQEVSSQFPSADFVFISSKDYDLTDLSRTQEMFERYRPDYVIHLAACVGGLYKNMNNKVEMFEKNVVINYNIVKCSHDYKIKKLVACLSTCIFPDKTTYPINETMLHDGPPHFSNDAYAYAKRMLEVHCRMYNENFGDNFVCVIPTNIYGKHDNFHLEDGHVLPALIHKCFLAKKSGKDFVIKGSGKPLRQFIYSVDLANLILLVLFNENISSDSIILSVPENAEVSIKDVGYFIAKAFEYEDRVVFDERFADGQYKKTADNSKLLGFFPDFQFTSIEKGIQETITWFLDNFEHSRV